MHRVVLSTIIPYTIASTQSFSCYSHRDNSHSPWSISYSLVFLLMILPFPECHVNRTQQFWVWLLSPCKMQVRFVHAILWISSSFYSIAESILLCTTVCRTSRLFPILKQLWIFTYRFWYERFLFFSFGCMAGSGIAGSRGRYMFTFIRNSQTVSQSGCAMLHPHQHLVLPGFLHFKYSNRHIVVPYCGFNLYFPND